MFVCLPDLPPSFPARIKCATCQEVLAWQRVVPSRLASRNGWQHSGRHCSRCLTRCLQIVGPQLRLRTAAGDSQYWNEPVDVEIEASECRSGGDLVVLTRVGDLPGTTATSVPATPKQVLHQQYVPLPTSRTVSCTFGGGDAPGFPGTYRFQYFCDGSSLTREPDAVSDTFLVRGPDITVIQHSGVVPYWGEAVGLTYQVSHIHDDRDFIALAVAGQPPMLSYGLFGGVSGSLFPVRWL